MFPMVVLRRALNAAGRAWRGLPMRVIICVLTVLFAAAPSAVAQTATLRVQVFDQTGAVDPQAAIILTDLQGRRMTSTSTEEGAYTFSGSGTYPLAVPNPVFRVESRGPILRIVRGDSSLRATCE